MPAEKKSEKCTKSQCFMLILLSFTPHNSSSLMNFNRYKERSFTLLRYSHRGPHALEEQNTAQCASAHQPASARILKTARGGRPEVTHRWVYTRRFWSTVGSYYLTAINGVRGWKGRGYDITKSQPCMMMSYNFIEEVFWNALLLVSANVSVFTEWTAILFCFIHLCKGFKIRPPTCHCSSEFQL